MQHFTKRERGEIYLAAAIYFSGKRFFATFACIYFEHFHNVPRDINKALPEFALVSPEPIERMDRNEAWWKDSGEENNERITALLLCYQMTQ